MKEFIANIYFLTTSEGGRKNNISGSTVSYRPLLNFAKRNYHCQIEFDDMELITLGNTYKLRLQIIDFCPIKEGDTFELKELSTIGRGKVLKLL